MESWWPHRQPFSNFLWCWGCTQGPTWAKLVPHGSIAALAGSSPPFSILGRSPSQEVIGILGTPQYRGVRSSAMEGTGRVWHRCEPGGHSICQAVPAAAQGWELCLSIQRAGQEALVSAWLWLLQLTLGLLGGRVLSLASTEMRRLSRALVTDLHSHTVHATLSCGHCRIPGTPN